MASLGTGVGYPDTNVYGELLSAYNPSSPSPLPPFPGLVADATPADQALYALLQQAYQQQVDYYNAFNDPSLGYTPANIGTEGNPDLFSTIVQRVQFGDLSPVNGAQYNDPNLANFAKAQIYNANLKDEFSFLGDNFFPAVALLGAAVGGAAAYGAFGAPSTLGTAASATSTASNVAQAAGAPSVLELAGGAVGAGGAGTAASSIAPIAATATTAAPAGTFIAGAAPVATGATIAGIPISSLIGPAITAGTGLIGGLINANAAEDAAETQADATRQANILLRDIYLQQRADQLPFVQAGVNALPRLSELAGTPQIQAPYTAAPTLDPSGYAFTPPTAETLELDPGYQFRVREGQKALERSAAARGGLLSGGTGKALQRYGQESASQEFQNAYQRALSQNELRYGRGLTQNQQQYQRNADEYQTNFNVQNTLQNQQFNRLAALAGVGQTSAGTVANVGGQYAGRVGENITGAGNAQAAGQVGRANAITGGVGAVATGAQQFAQQQQLNELLALLATRRN